MCPSKEDEFNEMLVSTSSEVLDFSDVILNFVYHSSSSPFVSELCGPAARYQPISITGVNAVLTGCRLLRSVK
jgi:hypothetical protein